jgi:uncharacterized protein DUF4260
MRILQSPSLLLRLEGAALLIGSVIAYIQLQASGWLFALLILAPDLSMLGYLAGVKFGSTIYNLIHIDLWPIALIVIGFISPNFSVSPIGLIWLAHIGGDRLLGFGLKYPTEFKDTHLQHI